MFLLRGQQSGLVGPGELFRYVGGQLSRTQPGRGGEVLINKGRGKFYPGEHMAPAGDEIGGPFEHHPELAQPLEG